MSNAIELGNEIGREVARLFPDGWTIRFDFGPMARPFDGWLEVRVPSGDGTRFVVEVKARFEPRDVDRLAEVLPSDEPKLLMAPHLTPRSRQVLKDHGICYADLAGNIWLTHGSLFIDRTGGEKLPRPDEKRSRSSLRGPLTGRAIRYLCDILPPLSVRGIATATNANPGNISRILELLARERFIKRADNGAVAEVDWEPLIKRWGLDLEKERESRTFLEPRGLDALKPRLSHWKRQYAITGSFASALLAPVVEPISMDVYVTDIEDARQHLLLRQNESVGNVRLVRAFDAVVFERTFRRADLILAGPSQIAADLVTMRKRSTEELVEMFAWMKRHEFEWRSERQ